MASSAEPELETVYVSMADLPTASSEPMNDEEGSVAYRGCGLVDSQLHETASYAKEQGGHGDGGCVVSSAEAPVATVFATGRGQLAIHTTKKEDRQRAGFTDEYAQQAKGTVTGAFMQVLAAEEQPATIGQVAEDVEAGVRTVVSGAVERSKQDGSGYQEHKYWQAPEAVGKELTQDWAAALGGSKAALILMVGRYPYAGPDSLRSLQPAISEESRLLQRALEAKGFETTLVPQEELQDVGGMRAALLEFAVRASACEVSVIVASGHGMQLLNLQGLDGVRLCPGGFLKHRGLENALPFREIQQAARGRKANLVLYGACREDAVPHTSGI